MYLPQQCNAGRQTSTALTNCGLVKPRDDIDLSDPEAPMYYLNYTNANLL